MEHKSIYHFIWQGMLLIKENTDEEGVGACTSIESVNTVKSYGEAYQNSPSQRDG